MMSKCWPMTMPPTAKAVLISLADNANDEGWCWPSLATIAQRTCFSQRAVQNAIAWLESVGLLLADRTNGRKSRYQITPENYDKPTQEVHPCTTFTPAGDSSTHAPRASDPRTSCVKPTQEVPPNRKEPSLTVNNRQLLCAPKPEETLRQLGVSDQVIRDWKVVLKAKRGAMTDTSIKRLVGEAQKAGISVHDAVQFCVEQSWRGFQADWYANAVEAGQRRSPSQRSARPGKFDDFLEAKRRMTQPVVSGSGEVIDVN